MPEVMDPNLIDQLCQEIESLVLVEATKFSIRAVRGLKQKYPDHLNHIKTAGRGRNKAAIREDLKQWINDIHSVDKQPESTSFPMMKHSVISLDEVPDDGDGDGLCPQTVPPRSDKIVIIAAYDAMGRYKGHCSGCLIDPQHALTAAHLFVDDADFENESEQTLRFEVLRSDGKILEMVSAVWRNCNLSIKTMNGKRGRMMDQYALCVLQHPVNEEMVDSIYPVFGLAVDDFMECPRAQIRIDGFPQRLNRGTNQWEKFQSELSGMNGEMTSCGMRKKWMRSKCILSEGMNGAPAFLCNDNGEYKVTDDGQPILIGIAIGVDAQNGNAICVPIKPKMLAMISKMVQHDVQCENESTVRLMMKAKKRLKL